MTSRFFAISTVAIVAALAGLAVHGCLDVRVVHIDEPGADAGGDGPGRDPDAPRDGPDTCELCLYTAPDPGPGCSDVMDTCNADQACRDTIACSLGAGCLELPERGAMIDCGTPCGRDAGLILTSPSITYVLAVLDCVQNVCTTFCSAMVPRASSPPR
jgi:hypothetical protein